MTKIWTTVVIVFVASSSSIYAQAPRTPPVLQPSDARATSSDDAGQPTTPKPSSVMVDGIVRTTSLVTIPAVVMDRNGRYIPNLRKEDFRIYENGVEQELSQFASVEKPFTVALMLDVSGSAQPQLAQIREAANIFVSRMRPNDRLMAITFDGQINVLTEPATVAEIRRGKLRIPTVTDGTVLYDAVDFVLKRMSQIQGRKAIVLMSDGVDQSSRASMQQTLADIAEQDVLAYTVQYNTLPQLTERLSQIKNEKARKKVHDKLLKGYALSEPFMRGLAEKTGGRFYRSADLKEVGPAFAAITAELGVQYSLGYFPKSGTPAGTERAVKVKMRVPNLVVRARESYTRAPAVAKKN
jgi:Ca-activated chloride channel family protein